MNPLDLLLDKTFPFPPGHELCDTHAVVEAMETYAKSLAVEFAEWMEAPWNPFQYKDPNQHDTPGVINARYALFRLGKLPWETLPDFMYGDAAKINGWHERHWTIYEHDVRRWIEGTLRAKIVEEPGKKAEYEERIVATLRGGFRRYVERMAKKWSVKVWFENNATQGKEVVV